MFRSAVHALIPAFIICLSLLIWRIAAPLGASMLVLLLPLAYLLFTGQARIILQSYRAGQRIVWQKNSLVPKVLTGSIGAIFGATIFTAAAIIILAWQAATAARSELWVFPVGAVLASVIYLCTRRRLGLELHDPFHRRGAIRLATWLGAAPIIVVMAWYIYHFRYLPAEVLEADPRKADLGSLWQVAWETMPEGSYLLQLMMSPLHFLDTLKLWLVSQYPGRRMLAVVVSIDAALFGIVVSRSAALLTDRIVPVALNGDESPIQLGRLHSRVFWGTIATLMVITVSLQVVAARRAHDRMAEGETEVEDVTAKLEDILDTSAGEAAQKAASEIDKLVDAAFEQVYLGIPAFTDVHYSVTGEYVELAASVGAQFENDIDKKLIGELPDQLNKVAEDLDGIFLVEYRRALQEKVDIAGGALDFGNVLDLVLTDAVQRAVVTKPIAVGASGAAVAKLLGKTIAKNVGAKIAAKMAAKGAVKGGTILAGAGTGTAVCAPAGPAALVCTAIGGIATWIAADMLMIRLDEIMNRGEFEAKLRESIDEQKTIVAQTLRQSLLERAAELHRIAPQQARNVTLSHLAKDRQIMTCDAAGQLIGNYAIIQDSIEARTSRTMTAFRADLDKASEDPVLKPMADEMRKEIDERAYVFRVSAVALRGNFRVDDRANRGVTGQVRVGSRTFELEEQSVTKEGGFAFLALPDENVDMGNDPQVSAALQQHLRVRSDRFFGGTSRINLDTQLKQVDDVRGRLVLPLQLRRDATAEDLASTRPPGGPSFSAELTLTVAMSSLADPVPLVACQEMMTILP